MFINVCTRHGKFMDQSEKPTPDWSLDLHINYRADARCIRFSAMRKGAWIFVLFLLTTTCLARRSRLKIASFNIQVFGMKKSRDVDVMQTLSKVRERRSCWWCPRCQIIRRYDAVFIHEIRDKSQKALGRLLEAVNDPDVLLEKGAGRTRSSTAYGEPEK